MYMVLYYPVWNQPTEDVMAAQHLARIDLSSIPQHAGGALTAFVGKEGAKLFPTDAEEAYRFRSQRAATRAAHRVLLQIRHAATSRTN